MRKPRPQEIWFSKHESDYVRIIRLTHDKHEGESVLYVAVGGDRREYYQYGVILFNKLFQYAWDAK